MNSVAALYVIAGVCAFAAIIHLIAALRHGFDPANAWFGGLSAAAVGFVVSLAWTYQASTIPQYAASLKWNIGFTAAMFVIFPWFFARLTGYGSKTWLTISAILFALVMAWNASRPFGITFVEI